METLRVNEDTPDGNYVIEVYKTHWEYITTEFSISVAVTVASNLRNATGLKVRVLSRRSNNMILSEM